MLAVATPLVPPSKDVIGSVTLICSPGITPVTFTVIVQVEAAAIAPPASEIEPLPARAVTAPPQLLATTLGVATFKPAGRLSTTDTAVKGTVGFGLAMLNVSVVTPLSGITATPNALLMVGATAATSLAVAELPVPKEEVTASVALFLMPSFEVTVTVMVQVVAVKIEAFAKVILPAPARAVNVPPQLLVAAGTATTVTPTGKVSTKPTPVIVANAAVFGF